MWLDRSFDFQISRPVTRCHVNKVMGSNGHLWASWILVRYLDSNCILENYSIRLQWYKKGYNYMAKSSDKILRWHFSIFKNDGSSRLWIPAHLLLLFTERQTCKYNKQWYHFRGWHMKGFLGINILIVFTRSHLILFLYCYTIIQCKIELYVFIDGSRAVVV